jgi:hypothetical protein
MSSHSVGPAATPAKRDNSLVAALSFRDENAIINQTVYIITYFEMTPGRALSRVNIYANQNDKLTTLSIKR